MTSLRLVILLLLVSLCSCGTRSTTADKSVSDTTIVLNTALKQATSIEFMPDVSALRRPSKFGDTILLTCEPLPLEILPTKSGNDIFKVLPKQTIYRILTGESYRHDIPNYLCVSQFEKNDTGYYVQVQNLSALPFGGGGSLGLYFKKVGDSLLIIDKASSSIN